MAYNHFDYVPSTIDRKRSIFNYDWKRAAAIYVGYLYPLGKPVKMMPGSSLSLNLAAEFRSQPLIAPLMSELQADFFAFVVPNRIVWEHWKQFLGAVDDVTFNNLQTYSIPAFYFGLSTTRFTSTVLGSGKMDFYWNQMLACHFGIQAPIYLSSGTKTWKTVGTSTYALNCPKISALPFRGYTFIWNTYFRPEQILGPKVFSKTDTGNAGSNISSAPSPVNGVARLIDATSNSDVAVTGGSVLPVSRAHRDLWLSCLPAPSLETLNLLKTVEGFPSGLVDYNAIDTTGLTIDFDGNTSGMNWSNVILTVNAYRETIMLQNYYDVLNRAGSRYDEIIRNIFGVTSDALTLEIPQLCVHKRFILYRKDVISTAETLNTSDQTVTPVGAQTSYIDVVVKDNFVTVSTKEHGYVHMMYCVRPATIYHTSGIDPDFQELSKFDLYYPQFDGMGDVPRYQREIYYDFSNQNNSAGNTGILGYQEYGATWKYQRSDAVGWCDPHVENPILGLVITDMYDSTPALNEYFITCWQEFLSFSQCCAITDVSLAPHFFVDLRLTGTITHPMPVYNIPGNGALL